MSKPHLLKTSSAIKTTGSPFNTIPEESKTAGDKSFFSNSGIISNSMEIGKISSIMIKYTEVDNVLGKRLAITVLVPEFDMLNIIDDIRIGDIVYTYIDMIPKDFRIDSLEIGKDEFGLKVLKVTATGLFCIECNKSELNTYFDMIGLAAVYINKDCVHLQCMQKAAKVIQNFKEEETSSNVNK